MTPTKLRREFRPVRWLARGRRSVLRYRPRVLCDPSAPFAIVLGAFARSGGKIGRSLTRVATLLRGRIALEDERKALTAQGRVSAIVLVALAPLGGMFFAVMTPEYLAVMFDRGRFLLVVAIALEIVGGLWLWRLLRLSSPSADLATLLDAVIVGLEAGLTFELALAALVTRAPMVARLPRRGASSRISLWGAAPAKRSAPSAARDLPKLVSLHWCAPRRDSARLSQVFSSRRRMRSVPAIVGARRPRRVDSQY